MFSSKSARASIVSRVTESGSNTGALGDAVVHAAAASRQARKRSCGKTEVIRLKESQDSNVFAFDIETATGKKTIASIQPDIPEVDAIRRELEEFIEAIRNNTKTGFFYDFSVDLYLTTFDKSFGFTA